MTIHRKEAPLPTALPPARLYLDDIQEILQVLREAVGEPASEQPEPQDETETTIEVRDQVTDELNDLARIHPSTTHDLFIEIRRPHRNASVRVGKSFTMLYLWSAKIPCGQDLGSM